MARQRFGERIVEFSLPELDGDETSLAEVVGSRRGTVVVFWSGVCSHCRRYDGYLNDFAVRHPELALVVIAARQGESVQDLARTVAERQLRFPILHDATREVARAWHAQQTPRVFLIDCERRLRYRGAIDNFRYPQDPDHRPYLDEAIAELLEGRRIARQETASFGCPIESVYYEIPKPFGV